jgi:hypothetical protein
MYHTVTHIHEIQDQKQILCFLPSLRKIEAFSKYFYKGHRSDLICFDDIATSVLFGLKFEGKNYVFFASQSLGLIL